jgi:hypothetical protein
MPQFITALASNLLVAKLSLICLAVGTAAESGVSVGSRSEMSVRFAPRSDFGTLEILNV